MARFVVWAPHRSSVTLMIKKVSDSTPVKVAMERDDEGWWIPAEPLPDDGIGEFDYGFVLDDSDIVLPDPRSRRQPNGVHGWSRTFDADEFGWSDQKWTGKQLAGCIIYELHVGTFTTEGTLTAAIERLDHLVKLGIDFVELMPVNAFNGPHNWGYDGVHWYAVHEGYGGPLGYMQFVDACHRAGLGVIQDVVYNHLGPSGNYLPEFGPYLRNDSGTNIWGDSPNLDHEESDEVRRYIIDNALMFLTDYHVDGLRLDAVHALHDTRATHLLEELNIEVSARSTFLRRPMPLIAESDLNDPRLITAREGGGYGLTAQWSDDFHHALYVSLTGDTSGYYADFDSLTALGKVFESGFFHTGTRSSFRGRTHGHPIDTWRTPTWRLVVCSDNHDQIGNRAKGERLSSKISPAQQAIAAMLTLLSPFTPMIFMGEEWGAATPWRFFTSHPEPELAEMVRAGRLEEFAQMEWDTSDVPDPQDPRTFEVSRLDWSELERPRHADLLAFTRRLITIRRTYPDFTNPSFDQERTLSSDEGGWLLLERGDMIMVVNFRNRPTEVSVGRAVDPVITIGQIEVVGDVVRLGPHSAVAADATQDLVFSAHPRPDVTIQGSSEDRS
ncbi:MAG TPA: malto-oligosyltrehalose trehalohydrolase [Propionibacteriaceae bacterium]|nr:malto-oligosyltrehalose trehalohydrolase [Propionibacteriaceae bacterium]